jgi:hypothetical protein
MYGVPRDLNLSLFYGARLNQICLGPFDLQFNFSTGANITVQSTWQLVDANDAVIDGSEGRVGDPPGNQSRAKWRVRSLLGDIVDSGVVDPPRSFTLRFASGNRLIVFDDSEEYESFSIQPGDIFV